jgi:hypothetical protein
MIDILQILTGGRGVRKRVFISQGMHKRACHTHDLSRDVHIVQLQGTVNCYKAFVLYDVRNHHWGTMPYEGQPNVIAGKLNFCSKFQ